MVSDFYFNIKETAIFSSIRWERFPLFKFANFFKKLFFILFIFSLISFGLSFLNVFSKDFTLGCSIIFLTITIIFWQLSLFLEVKLKRPALKVKISETHLGPQQYNLAEFLDFEAAKIVLDTIKFCRKRKISDIPAAALLYSSLKENKEIINIFIRLGFDVVDFRESLKNHLEKLEKKKGILESFFQEESFAQDFKDTIFEAINVAIKRKHQRIGPKEILVGISKSEYFKKILIKTEIKVEDIENITSWIDFVENKEEERKRFWTYENLLTHGSLGRDWAAGYTITLDKFSVDWREKVKHWLFKAIVGHEKEIEQIQRILIKPEANNILLVGEPGAGRDSIIEAIARRVCLGRSFPELNYNRVVELDLVSLLSQITNPEEVENVLDNIFQEVVSAGNVILVIKEFHNYVALDTFKPGAIDISGIIGKYLRYPKFKFIGVTTPTGLHTKIEQNPSLLEFFEKVEVTEISELELIRILGNLSLELERRYKVFITYPAIREIIRLTGRYLPNLPFPKKATDLLNEVAVYVVSLRKEKIVLPRHVAKVISAKTEIPIGKVEFKEKEVLLNLEKLIHQRIINQEEAVIEISTALRRARADISSKKRPMGVFLFLGPTGVGKTETSKALAEIYFGGEKRMIRLDMSEFQSVSDIPRLIGALGQEGLLTTSVRESPFSLVLLDEIEKAHPNILNLFLQVFDEGNVTDGQGRKTSFLNTIIICTSNAGAEIIWENIKSKKELSIIKGDLLEYFFKNKIFKPEWINRFDSVVVFKPLTKENLLSIAQLLLDSLKKNLLEKGIELIITEPLKEKMVELSYDPTFGAREMKRVIQEKIENVIAVALLSDKIKKGDKIEITAEEFKLVINP